MSFHKHQFTSAITRVLKALGLYSDSALSLELGTAAQESRFGKYLRQLGGGPARGAFQMEPGTERDIWDNYLAYRPQLRSRVIQVTRVDGPSEFMLEFNLAYQIAMCRVHYLRVPEYLPAPDDIPRLAGYWKRFYNTRKGHGTVQQFMDNYISYLGHTMFK